MDYYGRAVPKHAHGTENLSRQTSSSSLIREAVMRLYNRITNPDLLIRRITLVTNHVVPESQAKSKMNPIQLDLFTDYEGQGSRAEGQGSEVEGQGRMEKERRLQAAQLAIKSRYGKNAILRGVSYTEGATAKERNSQIGGHKA
jgi:DNA polymerase V